MDAKTTEEVKQLHNEVRLPLANLSVDTSHANDTSPYLVLGGIGIDRALTGGAAHIVLGKLHDTAPDSVSWKVFPHRVSFVDDKDKDDFSVEGKISRDDINGMGATIEELLQQTRANAASNKGTLFLFGELATRTGFIKVDKSQKPAGHAWAGLLFKKDSAGTEEWGFFMHCVRDSVFPPPQIYLHRFWGRRELWKALDKMGMKVTETSISNMKLSRGNGTCMINSMWWIVVASRLPGGSWKENDARRIVLQLDNHLHGENLYEKYRRKP